MLIVMILCDDFVNINQQVFFSLIHNLCFLNKILLINLELGIIEQSQIILSLHFGERLMRQVFFLHYEKLKICFIYQDP